MAEINFQLDSIYNARGGIWKCVLLRFNVKR